MGIPFYDIEDEDSLKDLKLGNNKGIKDPSALELPGSFKELLLIENRLAYS